MTWRPGRKSCLPTSLKRGREECPYLLAKSSLLCDSNRALLKTNTPTPLPSFPLKVLSNPSWLVFRHEVCFPGCLPSTHSFDTCLHFGVLGSCGRFIPPSHLHQGRKQRGGDCSQRQEARELLTETKAEEVTYFLWETITSGLGAFTTASSTAGGQTPVITVTIYLPSIHWWAFYIY